MQSGFRKRHSTETALIGIIDELLFNLDSDRVSGMILIDYCKAFDMVDHSILLQKLQAYGLDNKSLIWFRSYLSERRQLVSMGNRESPHCLCSSWRTSRLNSGPFAFHRLY